MRLPFLEVRIIKVTNLNYEAQLAHGKATTAGSPGHYNSLLPSPGPSRTPVPVHYRVQYRGILWQWFQWEHPLRSLANALAWTNYRDDDFGDDDFDNYEQAVRAANKCYRWIHQLTHDENFAKLECVPGMQESLYDN